MRKREIRGGVYLVVDPSYGEGRVLSVVKSAIESGLDVLQLWASWKEDNFAIDLGKKLVELSNSHDVPFVVNNDVEIAIRVGADGVHLDGYNPTPQAIRERIGNNAVVGVTCGTDIGKVIRAANDRASYVSFCSIYPSASVNECDLVPLRLVSEARQRVSIPIFASGGITAENAHQVLEAGADGVAVISEIMKSEDPGVATRRLKSIVARFAGRKASSNSPNLVTAKPG